MVTKQKSPAIAAPKRIAPDDAKIEAAAERLVERADAKKKTAELQKAGLHAGPPRFFEAVGGMDGRPGFYSRLQTPESEKAGRVPNSTKLWHGAIVEVREGDRIDFEKCPGGRCCSGIGRPRTSESRGLIPYDVRRHAAQNLRDAKIPEAVAIEIMGQSSGSMFRRYANLQDADSHAAAFVAVGEYVAAKKARLSKIVVGNFGDF